MITKVFFKSPNSFSFNIFQYSTQKVHKLCKFFLFGVALPSRIDKFKFDILVRSKNVQNIFFQRVLTPFTKKNYNTFFVKIIRTFLACLIFSPLKKHKKTTLPYYGLKKNTLKTKNEMNILNIQKHHLQDFWYALTVIFFNWKIVLDSNKSPNFIALQHKF